MFKNVFFIILLLFLFSLQCFCFDKSGNDSINPNGIHWQAYQKSLTGPRENDTISLKEFQTLKDKEFREFHAGYYTKPRTSKNFINFGPQLGYYLNSNKEICAIIDANLYFGFNQAKNIAGFNFSGGLRFLNSDFFYFQINSGLASFGRLTGADSSEFAPFAEIRWGFKYNKISLQFSIAAFGGKKFDFEPLVGLSIAFTDR